jgi:hypothetical protein
MRARPWRQVTPYRIEIREGRGWLTVFGLPFFGAGLFMGLSLLGVVASTGLDTSAARIMLPLMALAFTGVGGALVFGRVWTAIDRAEGTFERQWGLLLLPLRTETARLEECTAVVIGFTPGDSDSADRFPVTLKSRSDRHRNVFVAGSYADAREFATVIARLLAVDVEDATTDHAISVPASSGELSLQDRLRRDGRHESTPPYPSNPRSEVRAEGNGIRIRIPAAPTRPFLIAATMVPVAIVVAVFGPFKEFFDRTKTPGPIGWVFLGFFALLFAVIPGMTALNALLRSRWGATIVTASKEGIRIEERGAWRTATTGTYAAADIFDLDYSTTESTIASARRAAVIRVRERDGTAVATALSPGVERALASIGSMARSQGITIKTRQGLASFGAGLADDETRYLHALVRRALLGSVRL